MPGADGRPVNAKGIDNARSHIVNKNVRIIEQAMERLHAFRRFQIKRDGCLVSVHV